MMRDVTHCAMFIATSLAIVLILNRDGEQILNSEFLFGCTTEMLPDGLQQRFYTV